MRSQYSWWRYGVLCLVAGVPLQASAAPKGKCTHWFGVCVSCEAPLTCSNSRPLDAPAAQNSPSSLGSILSGLIPSTNKDGQQPTGSLQTPRKPVTPGSAAATPSDPDFESFKRFLKTEGISAQRLSDKEIRELYVRFRRWKASARQTAQ